ncbi:MAG: 1-acyl-sn-glycerol-3-phosphate acyltransferase [Bacilli bacterium]|nr:1-acyl-sn-glycerol-3-phosphate acyltransferase [Bacilli bacterium]
MKIKIKNKTYEEVLKLPSKKHKKPGRSMWLFRTLIRILSIIDLMKVKFSYQKIDMEKLSKKEPCLILMNHSSFIDLKIASKLLYPRRYNIVCTDDGFVGKELLMRLIGCIPTKKFINDVNLVRDMMYVVKKYRNSILLYPEASYSFDGTATPLPDQLGKFLKLLKIPVVVIKTKGAFLRDPLYNGLQIRKTKISATMKYVLSKQDIVEKSVSELNEILRQEFNFDNFIDQQKNGVEIKENFRADYLNRVLYKCSSCAEEGHMKGEGIYITCEKCGKRHELTTKGALKAIDGKKTFTHIPDWYKWQRECVKQELENNIYSLNIEVDIYIMKDFKCIYYVGEGILKHDINGFVLTGCDDKLNYVHHPKTSYSLYSDFYWYEISDVICIGDEKMRYYCCPKNVKDVVAKTRLAVEEIYKLK